MLTLVALRCGPQRVALSDEDAGGAQQPPATTPVWIYHQAMPRVDPDDDSIRRWVLRHYRYDPHRRQRRHVFVAAFDDKREFEAAMAREQRSLTQRQEHGGDPREHLTGLSSNLAIKPERGRDDSCAARLSTGLTPGR